ncbi:hypothetical protein D3C71_1088030 [compost metagenome]
MADAFPVRVVGDVARQHRLAAVGSSATAAATWADHQTIDPLAVGIGQAGGGECAQSAIFQTQHRAQHLRRDLFHFKAHLLHQLDGGHLAHHGVEHLVLQHLVHLGAGDVHQHDDQVHQRAVVIEDRVGTDRAPQRLPVLAVHTLVGLDGAARAQARGIGGDLPGPGAIRHQQRRHVVAQRFAIDKAEQAPKALVQMHDAALGVGDQHRALGFVEAQRQQALACLGHAPRGDIGDQGHADVAAVAVHLRHRHADPAMAAVLADQLDVMRRQRQFLDAVALAGIQAGVVALAHGQRRQHAQVLAQHFPAWPAGDHLHGVVEVQDAVALVEQDHPVADLLQCRGKELQHVFCRRQQLPVHHSPPWL